MPIANGVMTITPDDIKITRHLFDAFGHYETEVSAQWLVLFAQERGKGWEPFTHEEIEAFYNKSRRYNFSFNHLYRDGFIEVRDHLHHFTEQFIANCYKAAK